jgi:hypothetical protein
MQAVIELVIHLAQQPYDENRTYRIFERLWDDLQGTLAARAVADAGEEGR